MSKDKKQNSKDESKEELKPVKNPPKEVMSLDLDEHPVNPEPYDAETAVHLVTDALEEEYIDDVASEASMNETAETFAERQALAPENRSFNEKQQLHNSESPTLSGGDIDAAWDQANEAGTETVGGHAATPGRNDIDEMGKAMGIHHDRNEPLNISEKRAAKDENRAELDPKAAEEGQGE